MTVREKAEKLDKSGLDRALTRIAHEIVEQAGGADLALVGIKTRGETLAERIAEKIAAIEGKRPAVGALDIAPYRDDLGSRAEQPLVRGTGDRLPTQRADGGPGRRRPLHRPDDPGSHGRAHGPAPPARR